MFATPVLTIVIPIFSVLLKSMINIIAYVKAMWK